MFILFRVEKSLPSACKGVVILGIMLTGCHSTYKRMATDDLIILTANRELADRQRISVLEVVLSRHLAFHEKKVLGETLAKIVRSPLHSPTIRSHVVEKMLTHYSGEAGPWLSAGLSTTHEQDLREQIITAVAKLKDQRVVPDLILAWADEMPENEGAAHLISKSLATITGQPLEKVLQEQLKTAAVHREVRLASLLILQTQYGRHKAKQAVLSLSDSDPDGAVLHFWADNYDYLPTNQPRFLLCAFQQSRLSPEELQLLKQRIARLRECEAYEFDIRDSYLLLDLDDDLLYLGRHQVEERINRHLAMVDHTKRDPSYQGAPDDYPEEFSVRQKFLSYADLLRIWLIVQFFSEPKAPLQFSVFRQADFSDTHSEIGGLCYLRDSAVQFKAYEPGMRMGNSRYVESPCLLEDAVLCLSRWHCHTDGLSKGISAEYITHAYRPLAHLREYDQSKSSWRMAELAGPGADDLYYAAHWNCSIVVVAFMADGGWNVDYVTPEGRVVDLGNY